MNVISGNQTSYFNSKISAEKTKLKSWFCIIVSLQETSDNITFCSKIKQQRLARMYLRLYTWFAFGVQFFWEITVTYSMLLQLNMQERRIKLTMNN